jgi:hypothetical protein
MLGDKSENIAQLLRTITLQSLFRGPAPEVSCNHLAHGGVQGRSFATSFSVDPVLDGNSNVFHSLTVTVKYAESRRQQIDSIRASMRSGVKKEGWSGGVAE